MSTAPPDDVPCDGSGTVRDDIERFSDRAGGFGFADDVLVMPNRAGGQWDGAAGSPLDAVAIP